MAVASAWLTLTLGWAWPAAAEGETPWRLGEALGAPGWLRFGLEHRARFEHLAHDFRARASGDSSALVFRTLLAVELDLRPIVFGAELQDSRAWASEDAVLNTTVVNPLEPLQVYLRLEGNDLLSVGDRVWAKVGRMTLDVGSRRLVARNEFRNTINAFTGLELGWEDASERLLRAFAVLPVVRFPNEVERLAGQEVEIDREYTDLFLLGAFHRTPALAAGFRIEAYLFGLLEADSPVLASTNRRLLTPGVRLLRPPAPGELDLELEVMLQFGRSRASASPTDTRDLAHRALAAHVSVGRSLAAPGRPRIVLQYDYASGDHDPGDDANERFDPLFAARRFELGPTGIYGAIARTNSSSPGLRVELEPHPRVDAFVAYRLVWLASARDAWTTADLVDPSGRAGSFVGQQLEGRVRWHLWPGNLSLDVGGAGFARGEFARDAPRAREETPLYLYTQVTGTL